MMSMMETQLVAFTAFSFGGIIVPLIPWSMAGVYITGTLQVPTFSYAPWAFMNYLSVVILVIFGFTKFTMAPKIREDETQIGS